MEATIRMRDQFVNDVASVFLVRSSRWWYVRGRPLKRFSTIESAVTKISSVNVRSKYPTWGMFG